MRFQQGEYYFAVPCLEGERKMLVTVCSGGGRIAFSAAEPLETEWVKDFDGREIARVRRGGLDYTVSAASHIDAGLAQDVAEAIVVARAPVKPIRIARRGRSRIHQQPHGMARAGNCVVGGVVVAHTALQ